MYPFVTLFLYVTEVHFRTTSVSCMLSWWHITRLFVDERVSSPLVRGGVDVVVVCVFCWYRPDLVLLLFFRCSRDKLDLHPVPTRPSPALQPPIWDYSGISYAVFSRITQQGVL